MVRAVGQADRELPTADLGTTDEPSHTGLCAIPGPASLCGFFDALGALGGDDFGAETAGWLIGKAVQAFQDEGHTQAYKHIGGIPSGRLPDLKQTPHHGNTLFWIKGRKICFWFRGNAYGLERLPTRSSAK